MPTNGDFIQRHAEAVAIKNEVTSIHIVSDKNTKIFIDITDEIINDVRTIIGYVKFTKNPLLKWLRFIQAFRKILKKIKAFDVVHVNRIYPFGIFALYLKHSSKKPFIISEHWTGLLKEHPATLSFFEKFISKNIVRNAAFVCPVSQNLADSMTSLGFKGNYRIVPNVVDTTLFVPKSSLKNQFTLLHVSNMLDEHKNISGILHVVGELKKSIPDFRFILIGSNSEKYINQIIELSLQDIIEVIPQIEHQKIAKFMQETDAFVLFSNYENLPCVVLESFSCGLPVIATDVGGISEFFPHNFGYLIPKNDTQKLKETILHFYKSNTDYSSSKMHQYVENNFSRDVICEMLSSCYHNALKI